MFRVCFDPGKFLIIPFLALIHLKQATPWHQSIIARKRGGDPFNNLARGRLADLWLLATVAPKKSVAVQDEPDDPPDCAADKSKRDHRADDREHLRQQS